MSCFAVRQSLWQETQIDAENASAMLDASEAISLIDQIMMGGEAASQEEEGKRRPPADLVKATVEEQVLGSDAVAASPGMAYAAWRKGVNMGRDVGRYVLMGEEGYQQAYNQIAKLIQSREEQLVQYWEEWEDDDACGAGDCAAKGDDDDAGPVQFQSLWEFWQRTPLEKLEKLPDFLACFEEEENEAFDAEMSAITQAAHIVTW